MSWVEYTESTWRNLDMDELNVDESYIYLQNQLQKNASIYFLYEDCYKCPFEQLHYKGNLIKIDGSRKITLKIFETKQGKYVFENETNSICTLESFFGEFGVYNLTVTNEKCTLDVDKDPVNIYLPILLIFLLSFATLSFYITSKWLWNKYRPQSQIQETSQTDSNKSKRLKSLDVFRGFAIVLMIFVNSGGGHYHFIEHTPWNGLHLADIVFPSFLWIMGVAIPLSINIQLNRGSVKSNIFKHITIRSIKLFLIGLFLNSMWGPRLDQLRLMGVLQRFGISYLVCASFYLLFAKHPIVLPENQFKAHIRDLILMKEQLLICSIIVIIHLGIVFGIEFPGCPRGYLGPGGKHEFGLYENCTGGITGYIDELILGKKHIYQHSTAKELYGAKNFDPEGLFGSLLSVVQVFLGIQCGVILQVFHCWKAKSLRLFIWSLLLGLIGGSLCFFQKDVGVIPINKNLWSLSFVLITSSIAYLVILILYLAIDKRQLWSGHPFLDAGMNPIVLYVGHSILHKMLPWHWRIGLMNTHIVLLIESLWNTTIWVLISVYMFKNKIFYNV